MAVLGLADGIAVLHEQNPPVVYRDLKPANIVIQSDGKVRLADLGAAALGEQWMAGTPDFAAPEQFAAAEERAARPDARSDVYALGKVMYYMLTGCKTHAAWEKTSASLKSGRKIPKNLLRIAEKCMQESPGDRIQDMRELTRRLSRQMNSTNLQILRQELHERFPAKGKKNVRYEKNIWKSTHKTDL